MTTAYLLDQLYPEVRGPRARLEADLGIIRPFIPRQENLFLISDTVHGTLISPARAALQGLIQVFKKKAEIINLTQIVERASDTIYSSRFRRITASIGAGIAAAALLGATYNAVNPEPEVIHAPLGSVQRENGIITSSPPSLTEPNDEYLAEPLAQHVSRP